MSNIFLNEEVCIKKDLSIAESILLISIKENLNLEEAEKSLISKGYITANRELFNSTNYKWIATGKGKSALNSVMVDSVTISKPDKELEELAKKLKEIFPKGKKDGTNLYWSDGVALIEKRLKVLFKKYETRYPDEEILDAAKRYVESFNGDYRFMKVLKYFLFKDEKGAAGKVEESSELINYIENKGEETVSNLWEIEIK